ncbi:hypothetical protein DSO57_1004119 [Entomophthora muscae]|uniref:Uncharacterized protein n=1 Tax=Entomophthora muscae TaxID=34485 RepID=A0ACC2TIX2_9FUNG|nr:hypothetical protein DSO57_1004119 [Entomophthora muscae]
MFAPVPPSRALDQEIALASVLPFSFNVPVTVTNDKLLLAMRIEKPQLWDSNPGTLWAASLQAQPPAFFGLESEINLTLEKFPRLISMEPFTLNTCLQKDPVSSTNENAEPNNDPKITGATTNGGLKKLSQERGPPEDDKSCSSKREFEFFCFSLANEKPPMQDVIEGF